MSSLRSTFQDQDALLLLYSAGELSAEERASVQSRLETDATLRDRLATISSNMELSASAFEACDVSVSAERRSEILAVNAIRSFAMSQSRLTRKVLIHPTRRWMKPVAAAAAAILVIVAAVAVQKKGSDSAEKIASRGTETQMPPIVLEPLDALQLQAAVSLGVAADIDSDSPSPIRGIPPSDSIASADVGAGSEQPFFDVPLAADDATP